jgi:hypothetical protein
MDDDAYIGCDEGVEHFTAQGEGAPAEIAARLVPS